LKEQHYIYIIFSRTNTGVGRAIRVLTHNGYNHTSVSLNGKIDKMYSFARYHQNAPLVAGFVVETPSRYLANDQDIAVKVAKVPVSAKRYAFIEELVQKYETQTDRTLYNSLSALSSLVKHRVSIPDSYTCVEFAASLLGYDSLCTIRDLEKLLDKYVTFEGSYREAIGNCSVYDDDYFDRLSPGTKYKQYVTRFYRLVERRIHR